MPLWHRMLIVAMMTMSSLINFLDNICRSSVLLEACGCAAVELVCSEYSECRYFTLRQMQPNRLSAPGNQILLDRLLLA